MKTLARDLPHYLTLFGVLLAGFTGLIIFAYDKNFQIAISAATASSYASWGIVHHYLHKELHLETVIEYLVVAFLGFVIIFSIVFRT